MQQKHLNFFADFLLDLGGAVLYSIGIGLFAQNAGFAPGGISGSGAAVLSPLEAAGGFCHIFDEYPLG